MRNLTTFEKIFVILGGTLTVISAFLFFFQAERLGVYFGYLTDSKQTTLGKLEYSISDTLRKTVASTNFVNLSHQQKVFDRDTIMTNPGAEAVLSLTDGGSINVGPDSLIELTLREPGPLDNGAPQLILEVKKGTVTGLSGGGKKIQIRKDGKIMDLQAPSKDSLLTDVLSKNKAEMTRYCRIRLSNFDSAPPIADASGGMSLGLDPECDDLFTGSAKFSLIDNKGREVVRNKNVQFDAGKGARLTQTFFNPGTYKVKWDSIYYPDSQLTIPAEWPGLVIQAPYVACGGHLSWKKEASLKSWNQDQYSLEVTGDPEPHPVSGMTTVVTGMIKTYPAQVRVRTQAGTDRFFWSSPLVKIDRAPECNELISPKNEDRVKLKQSSSPVLFTWKQQANQGQVRLEVSQEYEFKVILKSEVTVHNFARVLLPTSGKYYWRVVDVKSKDSSSIFNFRLTKP